MSRSASWTVVGAKKGAAAWERPSGGKGTKLMALADRAGLPIAVRTASAAPHEVTLVDAVRDARWVEPVPERLIGERTYDSDPLDARLAERGIAMIAPHHKNRKRPKTQDGRALRRYKRRLGRAPVRVAGQLSPLGGAV